MFNEDDLGSYTSRQYNSRVSEYIFDTKEFAEAFIKEWKDKVAVDEVIWQNDEGTWSVLVDSRG